MADTFHFTLVTPERAVLDLEATFVAFPAFDGEMGVLAHRAPMVVKLGAGELRVEGPEGKHRYFVDGGFGQMVENRLTLLTELAQPVTDLDRHVAERQLEAALAAPAADEASRVARERTIAGARIRRRLAGGQR
jgi:F-type H+-transporting ATPase subunit epsilon